MPAVASENGADNNNAPSDAAVPNATTNDESLIQNESDKQQDESDEDSDSIKSTATTTATTTSGGGGGAGAFSNSAMLYTTNYASSFLGARVVQAHAKAHGAHNVLNDDGHKYLLTACSEPRKFFTVQLAREVQVTMVMIQSKEYFCSFIKDFVLLGSTSFPCTGESCSWRLLGTFTANFSREKQFFFLDQATVAPVRFLRLLWLSHHGDEKSCTMTHFHAFGFDVLESFVQGASSSTAAAEDDSQQQGDDEEGEDVVATATAITDEQKKHEQHHVPHEKMEEDVLSPAFFSDLAQNLEKQQAVQQNHHDDHISSSNVSNNVTEDLSNDSSLNVSVIESTAEQQQAQHNPLKAVGPVRAPSLLRPPTYSCGAIYTVNATTAVNDSSHHDTESGDVNATASSTTNSSTVAVPRQRLILDCCMCSPGRRWGNVSAGDCWVAHRNSPGGVCPKATHALFNFCGWICVPPRAMLPATPRGTHSTVNSTNSTRSNQNSSNTTKKKPLGGGNNNNKATSSQTQQQPAAILNYVQLSALAAQVVTSKYQKTLSAVTKAIGNTRREVQAKADKTQLAEQAARVERLDRQLQALLVEFDGTKKQLSEAKTISYVFLILLCVVLGSVAAYGIFAGAGATSAAARRRLMLAAAAADSSSSTHDDEEDTQQQQPQQKQQPSQQRSAEPQGGDEAVARPKAPPAEHNEQQRQSVTPPGSNTTVYSEGAFSPVTLVNPVATEVQQEQQQQHEQVRSFSVDGSLTAAASAASVTADRSMSVDGNGEGAREVAAVLCREETPKGLDGSGVGVPSVASFRELHAHFGATTPRPMPVE